MIDPFAELASQPRWVAWRQELRRAKPTKIPYCAATGRHAKVDDPATWSTRNEAERRAHQLADGHDNGGIGIVPGDVAGDLHLCGLDLDSCVAEDGTLAPWAAAILAAVPTYAEISPSGGGLKTFFYLEASTARTFLTRIGAAEKQWGMKRGVPGEAGGDHGPGIELYCANRYFTVTGRHWPGSPDRISLLDDDALDRLAALIPPAAASPTAAEGVAGTTVAAQNPFAAAPNSAAGARLSTKWSTRCVSTPIPI
jgi:putative DNA primase/helicase